MPEDDGEAVEAGLKYVNNDICYPSILTTGQIMAAVESSLTDFFGADTAAEQNLKELFDR